MPFLRITVLIWWIEILHEYVFDPGRLVGSFQSGVHPRPLETLVFPRRDPAVHHCTYFLITEDITALWRQPGPSQREGARGANLPWERANEILATMYNFLPIVSL